MRCQGAEFPVTRQSPSIFVCPLHPHIFLKPEVGLQATRGYMSLSRLFPAPCRLEAARFYFCFEAFLLLEGAFIKHPDASHVSSHDGGLGRGTAEQLHPKADDEHLGTGLDQCWGSIEVL